MATLVETVLKLRGSRQFQREADQSAKSLKGIGDASEKTGKQTQSTLKSMAGWAAGTAAVAGVGTFMKTAVKSASDLNEEVTKTQQIFGGASQGVLNWSKNSATAFGQSRQEALAAVGNFGGFFKVAGKGTTDAAKLSQQMVELAGDMASFNNTNPQDALDALRSGLSGEVEPLRRYRVFLSDAALKQEAMRQGIKPVNGAFTDQQKIMLRYGIIMRQTKDAQGDFARTSGGLANQQRILRSQYTNLAATVGKDLLPVMLKLAAVLGFLFKHTTLLYTVVGLLTAAFVANRVAALAASLAQLGLTRSMVQARIATLLTTAAFAGLNLSMLLIPTVIIAIIGGLVLLYLKCEWFRDAVQAAMRGVVAAFHWVLNAAKSVFDWIKRNWPLLVAILTGPLGLATYGLAKNWEAIKKGASDAVHWIANRFRELVAFVKRIPGEIVKAAKGAAGAGLKAAGGVARAALPGFQAGGTMPRSGLAVVGEAGPELVALPGGAHVFNARETAGFAASPSLEAERNQVIQLVVDGRVLAETVAQKAADKRARR